MRRLCGVLGLLLFLTGCSQEKQMLSRMMKLRENVLSAFSCSFKAEITADYGDSIVCFGMDCKADENGRITFQIIAPDTIAGIEGSISDQGGTISYESTALYFDLIADGQLTPASAPWIFMKTLRGGMITSVSLEDNLLHVTLRDGYEEDALLLDLWLTEENLPVRADILYDSRRILSIDVEKFQML